MLESTTKWDHAKRRIKPASVVLDLLHSNITRAGPVRSIMFAGGLFGFSENTMRVTLSRLVSRGLLESSKRGYYRLSESTCALNRFVDAWRLGEERCRSWDSKQWLICHLDSSLTASTTANKWQKSLWVLSSHGFQEVRQNFWVRPDNLVLSREDLGEQLKAMGLDAGAVLLGPCVVGAEMAEKWHLSWNTRDLEQRYLDALRQLQQSADKLGSLSQSQAMLESFTLGGEVVNLLAKDPLLPASWLNTRARRELWQAMLRYDKQGKAIWAKPQTINEQFKATG